MSGERVMKSPKDVSINRRRLLSLGSTAVAATTLVAGPAAAAPFPAPDRAPPPETSFVTITEGTNISAALSPDEQTVAFDLYGHVWTVPIRGGVAVKLTDELAEASQPDFTPDGQTIVFQSYRGGAFHLWAVAVDGTGLRQLTDGAFDCREPRVSPDGRWVAYSSDRTGDYAIHVLDLSTGQSSVWARHEGRQAFQPVWSPDGGRIVYAVDREEVVVTDRNGTHEVLAKVTPVSDVLAPTALQSPSFGPDGRAIIYHLVRAGRCEYQGSAGPLFTGEDVFPFPPRWFRNGDMLYTADGRIRRRSAGGLVSEIPFACAVPLRKPVYRKKARDYDGQAAQPVVGLGSPALSPDGERIAFRALNALYVGRLGARPKAVVDDGYWACDPAWSPDGRTLAYSSDRSGKLELWLRDLETGADRQLTHTKDAAHSCAWSKDGRQLAFLDQIGRLHRVAVDSGVVTPVFGPLWQPGRPSWSADGQTIACAGFRPYSPRFREGLNEILTVDVASGAAAYQPVFPDRSIGTRGDDGPVWSADGKFMSFVFASRLYIVPVDARGRMTASPRALNDEVTDAPTWSADGSRILYLSGGKLRLLSVHDGKIRTIPHGLTWATAKPKARLVVRAGKLWQGLGPELRRNVDVVMEGGRIADLVEAGKTRVADATFIDASDATVIPGLMEMHAHRNANAQGYGFGDRDGRLWLSLGVTTTRSPGSAAYHAIEDREALDAGRRVGPRFFCTGEAFDGARIYYSIMRPITEPGQLSLELERARALSYDLIKFYVRLPLTDQRRIVEWAHDHGMHTTGHYHYPVIGYGGDGQEHIGATSRWGYSRSVSLLGRSYDDVRAIFLQSGAAITPTLLVNSLYADDRSLIDDHRIRTLYPPWEYARLLKVAEDARTADHAVIGRMNQNRIDTLKAILRAGGRVMAATDSPGELNGISLHMNLRAMVSGGMTPYEVLLTATRFPGEFLDQPLGVIAPGMLADLVVTDGNPLVDIKAAAAVRHVVKNGEAFDIAMLTRPFEGKTYVAEASGPLLSDSSGDRLWWHSADYVEQGRCACCSDHLFRRPGRRSATQFVATEV